MPVEFRVFHKYNAASGQFEPLSDGPGEQAWPVVLATDDTDFNTEIFLFDSTGSLVAQDTSSGPGTDSLLDLNLTADTYSVAIGRFNAFGQAGGVTVIGADPSRDRERHAVPSGTGSGAFVRGLYRPARPAGVLARRPEPTRPMTIRRITGYRLRLPFRGGGYATAYGVRTHLDNVILEMADDDGRVGHGEICQLTGASPRRA